MLKPYLDAMLGLTTSAPTDLSPTPLFTTYYSQALSATDAMHDDLDISVLVAPTPQPLMSEVSDTAAINAEMLFWKAINALKSFNYPEINKIEEFWVSDTAPDDEDPENE